MRNFKKNYENKKKKNLHKRRFEIVNKVFKHLENINYSEFKQKLALNHCFESNTGVSKSISGWYGYVQSYVGIASISKPVIMLPKCLTKEEKLLYINSETGKLSMTNYERSQYFRKKYGSTRLGNKKEVA